ncbi:monocyte to macrophage differentiation factor 2 isoform X2 [Equus asinus]|uniref:monocyte to macrophage differentiation factor 2 isoform X2 n=2 Tax=Equus asinus TaxID=9793 RepID=UPI0038F67AA9
MFAPRLLDFQKTKYARFMNHRVPAHKRYQPTEYEHAANCATHALWIIPSILGSSNLYFLSDDDWETISAWIYGLGLCGLFVVSTVFHTISWKKSHLRMVEHCLHMVDRMVIYFFIAASYAPWLNLRELGPWASHMRWLVWIMASVGTVYVFFFHERYKLVELLCYIVMGFFPALVILSMHLLESLLFLLWGVPDVLIFRKDKKLSNVLSDFDGSALHLRINLGRIDDSVETPHLGIRAGSPSTCPFVSGGGGMVGCSRPCWLPL